MALARALEELGMQVRLFGLHPMELKAKAVDFEYFMHAKREWKKSENTALPDLEAFHNSFSGQERFDPLILSGNYAYQQPVNPMYVVEDLGLAEGEYVYFTHDVFPAAMGGVFDPANIPRVETGVHLRRVINSPGRGVGFRGAKALYETIIEAVMVSGKTYKPTLYGRVHGNFYENF